MADTTSPPQRLGAHVDSADPVTAAQERGAGLSQFFLGNPQGYRGPEYEYEGGPEALRAAAEAADIDLYIHAPYLINVATTNNRIRIPSRKLLQQFIDARRRDRRQGPDRRTAATSTRPRRSTRASTTGARRSRPPTEDPAARREDRRGDNATARTLERIVRAGTPSAAPTGPTMSAPPSTPATRTRRYPARRPPRPRSAITGRIDLVHCNDSRDEFDSGADRRHRTSGRVHRPRRAGGRRQGAGAPSSSRPGRLGLSGRPPGRAATWALVRPRRGRPAQC